ncbi:5'-nucleotidase C-terminal domain-containing protein [Paracoccus sp. (in: a-proteobacteria)]|uniref:5'-nucleotidase C-terminal domain-containing protein n=1 Tax=Paracoccus sp. TaxID=267 RepID=UPI002AFF277D|nr:5'-nucleotidase C-terminal domain-containing protein [Paracoccus sp. (in: a-proteobacteria)]
MTHSQPVGALELRIMATTDLHMHLLGYDYFADRPSARMGLSRTAGLIARAPNGAKLPAVRQWPRTARQSNGRLSGRKGNIAPQQRHPAIAAMNALRYDAATVGNHDFSFGLGFLRRTLEGVEFPIVSTNLRPRRPLPVQNHILLERQFHDEHGQPLITGPALMAHHRTLRHFRRRIGRTEKPLNSYFALIGDDPGLRLVAMAQRWHVRQALRGSCWQDLPILTAAAPFRAGGRGGPQHYTDVPAGGLTLRNIADLYLFPNRICAIHLTGAEVREWLERSASMFLRVEPGKLDQPLIDPDFPSYNFDIIDGLEWQIDPSLPPRYTPDGGLANGVSHRIGALTHRSRPVAPNHPFILVTNSFRLSDCGLFGPATAGRPVVLDGASRTRDILRRYVAQRRVLAPDARLGWSFRALPGTSVLFRTGPAAARHLDALSTRVEPAGIDPDGFLHLRLHL